MNWGIWRDYAVLGRLTVRFRTLIDTVTLPVLEVNNCTARFATLALRATQVHANCHSRLCLLRASSLVSKPVFVQQHVFDPIFERNLGLWSRFAPPSNDLWWPDFNQMESKHFLVECNFPFPDFAPRKVSRTNSAKIALLQWNHYLAAVFILNFHF